MGFKEWNERASESWSRYMDRLEASVSTPPSLRSEFLKSAKAPDGRTGIYSTGMFAGILVMGSTQAFVSGRIGLGIFMAFLSCAPGILHERRGKRILEQAAKSAPSPDV